MAVRQFGSYGNFATDTGGRGGGFLDWKKAGHIDVWLHMTAMPIISSRHAIPAVVMWEDRDTRKKEARIWSRKFVCHESATTLAEQHFYDDKARGVRSTPPVRCGVCKLIAWARIEALAFERTRKKEVHRGHDMTLRLFDFNGDRANERSILRLGGICNLFGWKDLKPSAKAAIKGAGTGAPDDPKIFEGGWNQNMFAKAEYGLFVVPDNDPEHGVRFTMESGGLGQAFQKELNDLMENGTDPSKTPIGMRWKYNEKAISFGDKYEVKILREEDGRLRKPSPRVRALIESSRLPKVPDDFVTPYNQLAMKMTLKEHCTMDVPAAEVPWGKLFPTKEQVDAWAREDAAELAAAKPSGAPAPGAKDEDEFACEECGKPTAADDEKCPHCGHEFDVDADDDEEEKEAKPAPQAEPAKKKKKAAGAASVIAAKEAPAGSGGSKKPPRPKEDESGDYPDGGEADEIPFVRDMTGSIGRV